MEPSRGTEPAATMGARSARRLSRVTVIGELRRQLEQNREFWESCGWDSGPCDTDLFDTSPRPMMEETIRTDRDPCTLVIKGDVEEAKEANVAERHCDLVIVGCIRGIVQARYLGDDPTKRLLALPELEAEITSVEAFGLVSRNSTEPSRRLRVEGNPDFVSDLDRQLCLVGSCIQQPE
jgi:hypothetical protein